MKLWVIGGFVWPVGFLALAADAAPVVGDFNIAGSLRASTGEIDFLNPEGEGIGGFVTLLGGTGYFDSLASTNLSSPYVGVVQDLTGGASSATDFLSGFTAPGYGGLTIDLNEIVASGAAPCTGVEGVNVSCSLGSFTVTNLGDGNTALGLVVRGSVEDSAVNDSLNELTGRYTTQTSRSVGDVVAAFAADGITASYSANFNATTETQVAEPGALLLLGLGLAGTGLVRRRRSSLS